MTFDESPLIEHVRSRVPGIPANATDNFDVTSHGSLTAADRKILRIVVATAAPELPREAILTARTLGELSVLVRDCAHGSSVERFDKTSYQTRPTYMRPVLPGDYEQLYFAALEPSNSFRWRYRGRTPSMDEFVAGISAGSLAEFVFASTTSNQLGAYCVAYNHDGIAGHCAFAVQRLNFDERFDTCAIESVGLFLNYLFETFHLRKVFAYIPEYNFPSFGLLAGVFTQESELKDFYWHGGRHWSEIVISTQREDWMDFSSRYFQSATDLAKRPRKLPALLDYLPHHLCVPVRATD